MSKGLFYFVIFFAIFGFLGYLLGPYLLQLATYQATRISNIHYTLEEDNRFTIRPVNTKFSLLALKFNINVPVGFAKADDPQTLEEKLKEGPIHLSGSASPGRLGEVILLAHPLTGLFNLRQLNPELYLLAGLEKGDEIDLFYNDTHYRYQVQANTRVSRESLNLESNEVYSRRLKIIIGSPPGSQFQYRLIEAEEIVLPQKSGS